MFKTDSTMSEENNRLNAVQIQQSTYGTVIPMGYGTFRIAGNVIDYTDFYVNESRSGGKGMNQGAAKTTYTYYSRLVIGLCQGTIQKVHKVWKSKTETTMADLGFSAFIGDDKQTAWGEMKTYHPDRALNYRHLAYAAGRVNLGTSSTVPNYNFEVTSSISGGVENNEISEGFDFSEDADIKNNSVCRIVYDSYFVSFTKMSIRYFTKSGWWQTWDNYPYYSFDSANKIFYVDLARLNCSAATVTITYTATTELDANPKNVIYDILTNNVYGAGYPADYIGDLSNFENYCKACGLKISPSYTSQTQAFTMVSDIANVCNAEFVQSQGKLKLIPAGDSEVYGNGVTWTPNLTPIYDLDDDDFLTDDDNPVNCTRSTQVDTYNDAKLEFLNRRNSYNTEVVEAKDRANQELYGVRSADVLSAHMICDPVVAQRAINMYLNRVVAFRNHYTFKTSIKYVLLDPMDLITITDKALGLERELVRIISVKEDEDNNLDFEVEEMAVGAATPAIYSHQNTMRTAINYKEKVGNVNPAIIFEPPFELTAKSTLEVWVGCSNANKRFGGSQIWISDDGETYKKVGEINANCRQGILTDDLNLSTKDIDSLNNLKIDLSMSGTDIISGTQKDADNLNTLCYVDGELLAYETATLTDDYKYTLSYLNRAAYNTENKKHLKGTQFARIDKDTFLGIPFAKEDIGKTIFVKILSFNAYGGGFQSLADVNPYFYTIQGTALKEAPEDITGLTNYYTDGLNVITWTPVDDTRSIVYEIRKGISWEQGQSLGKVSANKFTANGNGIYFIKAYSPDYNVYSVNYKSIEIDGARLVQNVIATKNEKETGWLGVKEDVVIVDSDIRLASDGLIDTITDFDNIEDLNFYGNLKITGIYNSNEVINIGASSSCYINVDFTFVGDSKNSKIDGILSFDSLENIDGYYSDYITGSKIQISIAGDDNIFLDWKDFVTGQYYGKSFKFRSVLTSTSNQIICKMTKFIISIDVPDIVETGTGIVIPVGGKLIKSEKTFHSKPNTQITILDKQIGDIDYVPINQETIDGFFIQILNNNIGVERSINYVRQGF